MTPLTRENPFSFIVPYLKFIPLVLVAALLIFFVVHMIRRNAKNTPKDHAVGKSVGAGRIEQCLRDAKRFSLLVPLPRCSVTSIPFCIKRLVSVSDNALFTISPPHMIVFVLQGLMQIIFSCSSLFRCIYLSTVF